MLNVQCSHAALLTVLAYGWSSKKTTNQSVEHLKMQDVGGTMGAMTNEGVVVMLAL